MNNIQEAALDVSGQMNGLQVVTCAEQLLAMLGEKCMLTLARKPSQEQWKPWGIRELWYPFGQLLQEDIGIHMELPSQKPPVGLRIFKDGKTIDELPSWPIHFHLGAKGHMPLVVFQAFANAMARCGYWSPTWSFSHPEPFAEPWAMALLDN